jgi:polar amino acid transport system ATP-binding protein/sulfate transport system ATP-binding protein
MNTEFISGAAAGSPQRTTGYQVGDVLVRIQDVGLSFDGAPVLDGVTAEVRDIVRPGCVTGQVVGILGPSGVGKTQLSRIMTGLQEPTRGEIRVGLKGEPLRAGLVGYVAQKYPLLRHRTVLGNLTTAARHAGCGPQEAKERAMGYLKSLALADKWDRYPAELSGGQQQRVAIAQQLLCSEHFLVLDEPTTGLDPLMKDKVCDLIKHVANLAEENTIFVVSHDIAAILTVADHLWLLGRARDEKGSSLGARIRYTYDLAERGLAWSEKPQELAAFADLHREIRDRFAEL